MKALLLLVAFAMSAWPAAAQSPAVKLWAVSDGVRVSPTTGRLIEDRPDIHKDYPSGDYCLQNSVWNGSTKTISLKAARNEFVAFQLVIEAAEAVSDVDITFSELKDAAGHRIADRNLAIFKEWYVLVRRPSTGYERSSLGPGWYPDALMPKRRSALSSGFPFSIPDLYNNIPDQKNHALWIDIFVPEGRAEAPPGRYTGTVEVTWQGGRDSVTVALEVWDFALPQQTHLKGDIWNGSMKEMPPDEELLYYQLCQQHRFLPLIYAYRPKLTVSGTKVTLDWSEYDQRLAPYLDGSAFTQKRGYWGPGYGIPIDHVMLPFDIRVKKGTAWPIDLPPEGRTPEYEAVWKEVGRQIRAHLDSDPSWRRVDKIAFLDGLDESYNEDAYEKMIYYGRLLHEAMGRGWFKYRIDGGYSREAMEKLSQQVELWVCHTVSFDAETARVLPEARRRKLVLWADDLRAAAQFGMRVEHFPGPGSAGEPGYRLGGVEVSRRLGGVGIRLERLCRLVRAGELQRAAPDLQRLGPTDLPRRGDGLPGTHSQHPPQSAAPGLRGLRVFLAAGAKDRQPRRRRPPGEHRHLQEAFRARRHAGHRDLEEQPGGVGPGPAHGRGSDCGGGGAFRSSSLNLAVVRVCCNFLSASTEARIIG